MLFECYTSEGSNNVYKSCMYVGQHIMVLVKEGKGVRVYLRQTVCPYQLSKDQESICQDYKDKLETMFESHDINDANNFNYESNFHYNTIDEFLNALTQEQVTTDQKQVIFSALDKYGPYDMDPAMRQVDVYNSNICDDMWVTFDQHLKDESNRHIFHDPSIKMFIERCGHGNIAFLRDQDKIQHDMMELEKLLVLHDIKQYWS